MPGGAVRAEVPEQSGVEQGRGLGAVPDLGHLPGVQRQGGVTVGQGQPGSGQPRGEQLRGDGPAALRPRRLGRQDRGGDRHPVQRKGAAQLG